MTIFKKTDGFDFVVLFDCCWLQCLESEYTLDLIYIIVAVYYLNVSDISVAEIS